MSNLFFREPHRMAEYAGMVFGKAGYNDRRAKFSQSIKCTQCVQTGLRSGAPFCHRLQKGNGRSVLLPDQEILSQVALRTIRGIECGHETGRVELVHPKNRPWFAILRI